MLRDSLFEATSLKNSPHRENIARILGNALDSVDPYKAVRKIASSNGKTLVVNRRSYDLDRYKNIFVVGAGKAAFPMASAVQDMLGRRFTKGIIIVKDGYLPDTDIPADLGNMRVFSASHPIPDHRGLEATEAVLNLVASAAAHDLVICVISGGGSALLTAPADGISLEDMQDLTGSLLKSGASINEINTLRKHLDRVKGGGLARFAQPAEILSLILSDVVGDPLDAIASGPTVPDPTRFQDCWEILARYHLLDRTPVSIIDHLNRGLRAEIPETLKPEESIFNRVHTAVIASNYQAAFAAKETAHTLGFNAEILTTFLQGEARAVGYILGAVLKQIAVSGEPFNKPACLIAGGETTVTVRGAGYGGRNLELALGSVTELDGLKDILLLTLATDGGDGPTDAAGALVTGETLSRAIQLGLNPQEYLERNDSYTFFDALGDLIKIGPTQTNVNDLVMMFSF